MRERISSSAVESRSYCAIKSRPLYWQRSDSDEDGSARLSLDAFAQYCGASEYYFKLQNFAAGKGEELERLAACMGAALLEEDLDLLNKRILAREYRSGMKILAACWQHADIYKDVVSRVCGESSGKFYFKFDAPQESRDQSRTETGRMGMQVSVIIPVYNMKRYLKGCIESVLNQSNVEFEVICINDGSTDGSLEILEQYARQDPRIRIVSQDNSGLSASRNLGISLARGEYLLFVDSDDALAEGAIDRLYHCAVEDDVEVLFFNASAVFENSFVRSKYRDLKTYYETREDLSAVISGIQMISRLAEAREFRASACLQLTKREYLLKNSIRFIDYILHEDNAYTFELLLRASRVKRVNEPLYIRNVRDDSIVTSRTRFAHFYGYLRCYMRMMTLSGLMEYQRLDEEKGVQIITRQTARNTLGTWARLDEQNKMKLNTLSPLEKYVFDLIRSSESAGYAGTGAGRTSWFVRKYLNMLSVTANYYRKHGLALTLKKIGCHLRAKSWR